MRRRHFLGGGATLMLPTRLSAGFEISAMESSRKILADSAKRGVIESASIHVQQGSSRFSKSYGLARDEDAIFLLASISKTISVAAVMTLFDEGLFRLDDRVTRFIPEFKGEGRDAITIRHLMTHISGLPDQLPENARLRSSHAPLEEFVAAAIKTPLLFRPGARYGYSSMAILLATEVARRISGLAIADLAQQRIFTPLQMDRSAMGLGEFKLSEVVMNQVDRAAPESGAGDPKTKAWDWNSRYWRNLGAPWGAAHGSAGDVARFLNEFLHPTGTVLKPSTIELMIGNHNPPGIRARGLGFDLGQIGKTPGVSDSTFGHTGSTGTICWADPTSNAICVVLTTLPHRALDPHPRDLVSAKVAEVVQKSR